MSQSRIYLGIDGGGSGCRARAVDEAGRVLGEWRAGPANLRLGADVVWKAMHAAAHGALQAAGLPAGRTMVHAAAGLAGATRGDAFAELTRRTHDFASLTLVEDTVIACVGAYGGRDGGIVIAGTGSVGFGIIGTARVRVGGYGFPISDEGSGADIGLEALRCVALCLDGRLPATPLLTELLAKFDGDAASLIGWMDRAGATDYAAFAEVVVRHAAAGDETGRSLMANAARRIEMLVVSLFERNVGSVALVGGLAPALEPHVSSSVRLRLTTPVGDALDGALFLARRNATSA